MGIRNIIARRADDDDPEDLVGSELDGIFLESVFPVAMALAGLFVLFTLLHPLLLPHPAGAAMAALAAASGTVSRSRSLFSRASTWLALGMPMSPALRWPGWAF